MWSCPWVWLNVKIGLHNRVKALGFQEMTVPRCAYRSQGKLEAISLPSQTFIPGLTCGPVLCKKGSQWPDSMIHFLITQTCLKMVHFAVLKVLIATKEHCCSSAQLSHNWVLEIFITGGEKDAALREIKTCSSLISLTSARVLQEVKSMKTDIKRTNEWTGIKLIISKQLL